MTVRCPKDKQEDLLIKLEESLQSARLEDRHCSQMKFKIPQLHSKLSDIFNVMYTLKEGSFIEDYSVSQTTLDDVSNLIIYLCMVENLFTKNFVRIVFQIFVKFASNQKDDMDR